MDSNAPESSITLDMIRKAAISRRGGVKVRGGRLPPIRIRDVAPTSSNKKVIAPKIPQRRIAIKKEIQEPSERTPTFSKDDRKDFRKPFGRGRGQKVYIQTEGSFLEQGPAFRLKKETVVPHYDRISRSSSRTKFEMDTKINVGQINLLLEESDGKDAFFDYENDLQPVLFPHVKKETKTKIKEEILDEEDLKPKIKDEILNNEDVKPKMQEEILDNGVKIKIKKEPEDETEVKWALPDGKQTKEEMPEPKICSLLEAVKLSQEEDVFLLFQLPSCLPFKRFDESLDQPTKKDKNLTGGSEKIEKPQDDIQGTSFKDMSEGSIGRLQITKSGQMRLALGSIDIEIESGVNEGSVAEVVSIPLTNNDEGDFIVLGKIYQNMIMNPILTDSENEICEEKSE